MSGGAGASALGLGLSAMLLERAAAAGAPFLAKARISPWNKSVRPPSDQRPPPPPGWGRCGVGHRRRQEPHSFEKG